MVYGQIVSSILLVMLEMLARRRRGAVHGISCVCLRHCSESLRFPITFLWTYISMLVEICQTSNVNSPFGENEGIIIRKFQPASLPLTFSLLDIVYRGEFKIFPLLVLWRARRFSHTAEKFHSPSARRSHSVSNTTWAASNARFWILLLYLMGSIQRISIPIFPRSLSSLLPFFPRLMAHGRSGEPWKNLKSLFWSSSFKSFAAALMIIFMERVFGIFAEGEHDGERERKRKRYFSVVLVSPVLRFRVEISPHTFWLCERPRCEMRMCAVCAHSVCVAAWSRRVLGTLHDKHADAENSSWESSAPVVQPMYSLISGICCIL